jgi:uncharacterized integral membrane protein
MLALGALVVTAGVVFAVQNRAPTTVRLVLWPVEGLPLAALVIVPTVVSSLAVGLTLMTGHSPRRSEMARTSE